MACRATGAQLADLAAQACDEAGLDTDPQSQESFNWLMTRDWMLTVPRAAAGLGPVTANAMGFAGTLFLRSQEEFDYASTIDPMDILAGLGRPW
jgi:sulfate adenylyltransferase (ADP) / ATP adenylyltransferase